SRGFCCRRTVEEPLLLAVDWPRELHHLAVLGDGAGLVTGLLQRPCMAQSGEEVVRRQSDDFGVLLHRPREVRSRALVLFAARGGPRRPRHGVREIAKPRFHSLGAADNGLVFGHLECVGHGVQPRQVQLKLDVIWLLAQLALDVLHQPGHGHLANLSNQRHSPDIRHHDEARCEDRGSAFHSHGQVEQAAPSPFVRSSAASVAILRRMDGGWTRREFLGTGLALALTPHTPAMRWHRRPSRWGQPNITEKDPVRYDIGWWRAYWKRTEVQAVIVNTGGDVAY